MRNFLEINQQKDFLIEKLKSLDDPVLLSSMFPNLSDYSNYDTYFYSRIKKLKNNKEFISFLQNLKIKKHNNILIIEIPNIKNIFLTDYFLQLVSFLLRNDQNNNQDIVFYNLEEKNIRFLPSPKNHYNGGYYDQVDKNEDLENNLKEFLNLNNSYQIIYRKNIEKSFCIAGDEVVNELLANLNLNGFSVNEESFVSDIEKTLNEFSSDSVRVFNIFKGTLIDQGRHAEQSYATDKITTIYSNTAIAKRLGGINKIDMDYFDTIYSDPKNLFPNINLGVDFSNNDLFGFLSENIGNQELSKEDIKERIKKSLIGNNAHIKQSRFYEYISRILLVTKIDLKIKEYIKLYLTKKNGEEPNDDELKGKFEEFIIGFVLPTLFKNIEDIIFELIDLVSKSEIKSKYELDGRSYIRCLFQNIIISKCISIISDENEKYEFLKYGLVDSNFFYNKSLSSQDIDFLKKISNSIEIILNSEDFGQKLFTSYCNELINSKNKKYSSDNKNSIVLCTLNDGNRGIVKLEACREGENILFRLYPQNKEISFDELQKIICNYNNIINYHGAILIMVFALGGVSTLGGEDIYRKSLLKALQKTYLNKEGEYKKQKFLSLIESLSFSPNEQGAAQPTANKIFTTIPQSSKALNLYSTDDGKIDDELGLFSYIALGDDFLLNQLKFGINDFIDVPKVKEDLLLLLIIKQYINNNNLEELLNKEELEELQKIVVGGEIIGIFKYLYQIKSKTKYNNKLERDELKNNIINFINDGILKIEDKIKNEIINYNKETGEKDVSKILKFKITTIKEEILNIIDSRFFKTKNELGLNEDHITSIILDKLEENKKSILNNLELKNDKDVLNEINTELYSYLKGIFTSFIDSQGIDVNSNLSLYKIKKNPLNYVMKEVNRDFETIKKFGIEISDVVKIVKLIYWKVPCKELYF